MTWYDVVVVGSGNAGMSAALAARERGCRVLIVEWAPPSKRGGNSRFTAGGFRFAYSSADEIVRLVSDVPQEQLDRTDFGSYTAEHFYSDIERLTEHRANPDLADVLVRDSYGAVKWLRDQGVKLIPIYGRQAYNVQGRFTFWGGVILEATGGGAGLVEFLEQACSRAGVDVVYDTRARELVVSESGVIGLDVEHGGARRVIECGSVILACGGFQASAERRARYLGPGWDVARVRGTEYNVGDGIEMALSIGASPAGQWSGCHAVAWDLNAPEFGDRRMGDLFQKHSYPLGIMVNQFGERFVDEGADFRNYTYAKYGREILAQPGQRAWQIFDNKVAHLLRDEYRIREVTKYTADSIEELGAKVDGLDGHSLTRTVEEFNAAVTSAAPFDPNSKDGRSTSGLAIPKSNWAQPIDQPPYQAYGVTCGITFTFGGLRIDPEARVLAVGGEPIPNLYAAGELVGGLHYFNYAGGTGLTGGTVFGRRAGYAAAAHAESRRSEAAVAG